MCMVYIPVHIKFAYICLYFGMFTLAYLSQYVHVHTHTGMVTLSYSTAMVVYSYDQVPIAAVSSQKLLAVTVKLAT